MKIDLSVPVTQEVFDKLSAYSKTRRDGVELFGHVGTHLDLMGKDFDIDKSESAGVVFDVSAVRDREIGPEDVDWSRVREGDFVMFHTGALDDFGYGNQDYFLLEAPQLSYALIDGLMDRKAAFIGVDMGGARKVAEHRGVDEYCAERGMFIVENLANLERLSRSAEDGRFGARIYPMNLVGATGLPCRVVAEV
ncbi:MAG: cyclase family protein [Candidatus Accumulibacter sp.]|jgi:kynurenine formamidase|nr:cyclase family protein [Accumulibacter sp.]